MYKFRLALPSQVRNRIKTRIILTLCYDFIVKSRKKLHKHSAPKVFNYPNSRFQCLAATNLETGRLVNEPRPTLQTYVEFPLND